MVLQRRDRGGADGFLSVCCFVSGSVSDFCCACIKKLQKNEYRIDDTSDKGELSSRENYSKTSGDGDLPKGDKAVFGSTIYCVNMGIGVLMSLMLAVASFFVSDADLKRMLGVQIPEQMLKGILPLILGALIMMTCTTSVSLSPREKSVDSQITSNYEGRNL